MQGQMLSFKYMGLTWKNNYSQVPTKEQMELVKAISMQTILKLLYKLIECRFEIALIVSFIWITE